MNNNTSIALTKQSSQPEIKAYFEAVMRLANGNEQFPVNLDEVWPLVYGRKEEATRALRDLFMQDIDYQALRRNAQLGAASPIDYFLSISCLEYFIARKVRPVFEVYRQVFHKATQPAALDFSNPETVLMLAQNWKDEMDRRLAAEAESERLTIANEEANQTIKIQAPKVKAFEEMINSEGLVSTTQIAMEHGISAIALNRKLCALGIQYKQGDTYILYAKYKDKDFATLRSKPGGVDQYGNTVMRMHLYWTQRGRVFIHNLLTA